MSTEVLLERLARTPVTDLNLGEARLRRVIKKAGFETLIELFELSESEIDELFDLKDADAIIGLREKFHDDPVKFAESALERRRPSSVPVELVLSKAESVPRTSKPNRIAEHRTLSIGDGPTSLPPTPFAQDLIGYEKLIRGIFEDLDDRYQDVMVYQAFGELSTELDGLSSSFEALFRHYASQPRAAIGLADRFLRNAFVVFVADRARNSYNEGNLWGNFFEGLGVRDNNAQRQFKQVFVGHIERRGMPLYARDEETNYYFYTALLHGGLSADSWANLWQKSLLPLAREIADGGYVFCGEMDGHAVLKELKDPNSRFAPKKAVLNILDKAPDSTIAPLFEASLRVAEQLKSTRKQSSGYTMLSNYGLPDVAMQALRENQERKAASVTRAGGRRARGEESGESRLVYLPMASLQLDVSTGTVSMRWPKQQFPLHFADCKIDYCIDGKLTLSKPFEISVGKCILESAELSVKPQARYDVEIKLMQKVGESGSYEEMSSLRQTFSRSKPGCFEFVGDSKGSYRLRDRNERISRKRRIAYLVKSGYVIQPGLGMTAVSEYDTSGSWDDAQIFVYDVDPGAAGAIVDSLTGEELAVWQERYRARIDKRRIIGETTDGLDLYGYAPNELGTNGGLPSINIEVADGLSALEDLDIVCLCDGVRVSMPRHVLWSDEYGGSSMAMVALVPQESILFDWHIETCEIVARQKSNGGKAVFRYRFSVAPIQDFRLRYVSLEYGVAVADYGFQAITALDVVNAQGEEELVNAWGRYSARTLLKDEFLFLRIESLSFGKKTEAKLALAAIDVEVPNRLASISEERPVCLADALELGPSEGNFKVRSFGWRYNRAVIALFGFEPLFFKELKGPGEYGFNLFRHAASFVQGDDASPVDRPLVLSIVYGDDVSKGRLSPAWTDVPLLRCQEGVGISNWKIYAKSDGSHVLKFEGRPLCNLHFDFKRKVGGRIVAEADASAGAVELTLPASVVRCLDLHKKILVTVAPTDWFGEPEYEYATEFALER